MHSLTAPELVTSGRDLIVQLVVVTAFPKLYHVFYNSKSNIHGSTQELVLKARTIFMKFPSDVYRVSSTAAYFLLDQIQQRSRIQNLMWESIQRPKLN